MSEYEDGVRMGWALAFAYLGFDPKGYVHEEYLEQQLQGGDQ